MLRLLLLSLVALAVLAPAAAAHDESDDRSCEAPGIAERVSGGDDECVRPGQTPGPPPCSDDATGSAKRDRPHCPKPPCEPAGAEKPGCRPPGKPCPPAEIREGDGAPGARECPRTEDRKPPRFRRAFLNRVWRFDGLADFYEDGVLGMTVERVRGLPRKLRDQDDAVLDQDALVLVGPRAKVYGPDGKRTTADALAGADAVRVHAKLLPPAKWREDEDGQATPTLRAKRVYIVPAAPAAG